MTILNFADHALGMDALVTVTLYQELKGLKAGTATKQQRIEKLQLFNTALDATLAWLGPYSHSGFTVTLDSATVKFYPRVMRYDADQPELVSVISKTCYMCMSARKSFGDATVECGIQDRPLTASHLRGMREAALSRGKKKLAASLGMRNPEVNYRALSRIHTPLLEMRVGGIARVVRADSLHILELGLLKKFFEDSIELLSHTYGPEAVARLNEKFTHIEPPPGRPQMRRWRVGPYREETLDGKDYVTFIWMLPEALVMVRGDISMNKEQEQLFGRLLHLSVKCRELTTKLHFQTIFNRADVQHIQDLVREIRAASPAIFLRERWNFPKSHTLTSLPRYLFDNGIGRCHLGEASHRYLKERIRYLHRRGDYAAELLQVAVDKSYQQLSQPAHVPDSERESIKAYVRYQGGAPTPVTVASLDAVVTAAALSSRARTSTLALSGDWSHSGIYLVDSIKLSPQLPLIRAGLFIMHLFLTRNWYVAKMR